MHHKTLIILPGWGGSHETWADFVALAKKEFADVKVIDLPCFGAEPCPETVWGIQQYANFTKNKISELRTPNSEPVILGHSFGGAVAVQLVADNPGICERLVLSGAAVFRPKKTLKRLFFGLVATLGKWVFKLPIIEKFDVLAKKVLYRIAQSPDYAKTSGIKQDIFKKIIREDVSHLLPQITVPTLVVWGSKDAFVPLTDGARIAAQIPNAKFQIITGAGHGLHLNHPEALLTLIGKFL